MGVDQITLSNQQKRKQLTQKNFLPQVIDWENKSDLIMIQVSGLNKMMKSN